MTKLEDGLDMKTVSSLRATFYRIIAKANSSFSGLFLVHGYLHVS